MTPNLHWTVYQAEQMLHALIEDGIVEEIELNKYRPKLPLREVIQDLPHER